jgi:PepSY-associated TM region
MSRWHAHDSLPAFLFQLHAHLLAGTPGEVVNGFIALLLIFMGLTGLMLWWPRRAAAFRLARAIPRTLGSGDLLRSHAASGALLVVPVILFCSHRRASCSTSRHGALRQRSLTRSHPKSPRPWSRRRQRHGDRGLRFSRKYEGRYQRPLQRCTTPARRRMRS